MLIKRDLYLNKLISYRDKDLVKVITGIRRCGKSVLLFDLYYEYLLASGVDKDHIIKINLEEVRNFSLHDRENLYAFIYNVNVYRNIRNA